MKGFPVAGRPILNWGPNVAFDRHGEAGNDTKVDSADRSPPARPQSMAELESTFRLTGRNRGIDRWDRR